MAPTKGRGVLGTLSPSRGAQPAGEGGADADEAGGNDVGGEIKHAPRFRMVESLAIDEKQHEALLGGKIGKKTRRRPVGAVADKRGERCGVDRLLSRQTAVDGTLSEPPPVNLGESPGVERPAPLIAVLLGEHQVKRAAKERGGSRPLADENIGEALEPRQMSDQPRPDLVMEIFRLHFGSPRLSRGRTQRGYGPRESKEYHICLRRPIGPEPAPKSSCFGR